MRISKNASYGIFFAVVVVVVVVRLNGKKKQINQQTKASITQQTLKLFSNRSLFLFYFFGLSFESLSTPSRSHLELDFHSTVTGMCLAEVSPFPRSDVDT